MPLRDDRRVALSDERAPTIEVELREAILSWYDRAARDLPFRRTRDPYAILVSEAMAQQTQAVRAGDAWTGFMERFPTVELLAAATPADVLRAWQGLGYNRRALNLWRAARRIVEVHGGQVPSDLAALEDLPGVGPYTARAVAAFAFGMPVGAGDTNVRRVLGRIVAGDPDAMSAAALQRAADAAVPDDRPGSWTHALMDLGATVCGSRVPRCGSCPARPWCRFATSGSDSRHPFPPARSRTPAAKAGMTNRAKPQPFPATSRWLRGQIVHQLGSYASGDWVAIEAPIGSHDNRAVEAALRALAREGLVELRDGRNEGSEPRAGKPWLARLSLV